MVIFRSFVSLPESIPNVCHHFAYPYSSKDRDWDLELVNSHSVSTCLEGMWSTRGWEVGWNPLSMILGDVDLHDGKGVKHPKKAGKLDWNSDKIWQDLGGSMQPPIRGDFGDSSGRCWWDGSLMDGQTVDISENAMRIAAMLGGYQWL